MSKSSPFSPTLTQTSFLNRAILDMIKGMQNYGQNNDYIVHNSCDLTTQL